MSVQYPESICIRNYMRYYYSPDIVYIKTIQSKQGCIGLDYTV